MSYKKALKKLESLPPGERQLAAGQYVWEVKKGKSHCGCAIGKLLTERQRVGLFKAKDEDTGARANLSGVESLASFLRFDWESDKPLVAGLTYHEADQLQTENDSFAEYGGERNTYKARKARYKHILAWLKEQIASPGPVAAAEF